MNDGWVPYMCYILQDVYSDYLIAQNKYATATGLSAIMPEEFSHDQITRFLNKPPAGSKELWLEVKPDVRRLQDNDDGILSLDDMVSEKPYTDENLIMCWHYSHAKKRLVKGVNLLTMMIRYGDVSFPIGYEVVKKDIHYCDIKTKKEKRQASISKNTYFRMLIGQAVTNCVKFKYILADSWFASKENMKYIHMELKQLFIFGIKSNRSVAMTEDDKQEGRYQQLKDAPLEDGVPTQFYLKEIDFPVLLMKEIFKNEDGSTGTRYLVTNDLSLDASQILELYKKRWSIEEYHKSVKQNTGFEKSPTRTFNSQLNHMFCSIIAFCKLERLKIKTKLNHFAIKYKLILRANQIAMKELKSMAT